MEKLNNAIIADLVFIVGVVCIFLNSNYLG